MRLNIESMTLDSQGYFTVLTVFLKYCLSVFMQIPQFFIHEQLEISFLVKLPVASKAFIPCCSLVRTCLSAGIEIPQRFEQREVPGNCVGHHSCVSLISCMILDPKDNPFPYYSLYLRINPSYMVRVYVNWYTL